MKKQRTVWQFKYIAAKNTYIKIGWIYNKSKGVREDKIRIKINSLTAHIDFNMRIDEATALVTGIGKVLCIQSIKNNICLSPQALKGERR